MNPKKFVLIDGNAIIHRAFHALPPLNAKDGEMVNAVYGFFSMLIKILQDLKPDYLAVCFDRPKPTFRQTLFAGYQQSRPKMSEDLVPQIAKVHCILERSRVPIFEIDGYEADDLIGTLSVKCLEDEKKEVIIVSGDRDLLQLVNHHVKMLAPIVGLSNTILYDSSKVEERFGIKPLQIIDYKALIGDASDNYPGVAGIGPKTAVHLLNTYGSLEGIYEHLGEIAPKISQRLAQDCEQAALAKKLATVILDVPATLDMKKCLVGKFDMDELKKSFEELGFKSLVKRVEGENNQNKVQETPKKSSQAKKRKESPQLELL